MALNILIVDDSQIVRAVIAKSLDLANVPVRTLQQASNGVEALKILVSSPVDLVFVDINMPVMGGVEMVERMSRDDHLWAIPIVIVSTEGSATRIEQLKSKGARAYLRKPFKPEAIRAVVDEVMGVQNADSR
jgi:two-component system chemotaxis response regulator CheY